MNGKFRKYAPGDILKFIGDRWHQNNGCSIKTDHGECILVLYYDRNRNTVWAMNPRGVIAQIWESVLEAQTTKVL